MAMSNDNQDLKILPPKIFQREYYDIVRRQNSVCQKELQATDEEESIEGKLKIFRPSVKLELVGLAFSGGGIRSATFNLGVLQGLCKRDKLKYVDYLSTVSGGGYIGSCLSSVLNNSGVKTDGSSSPLAVPQRDESIAEKPAVKYLRSKGNYLISEMLVSLFRIPALLFRGILVNFLIFVPYIILAVGLTEFMHKYLLQKQSIVVADWFLMTKSILLGYLLWVILFPILSRFKYTNSLEKRDRYGKTFGVFLIFILAAAFIELLPLLLQWYTNWIEKGLIRDWGALLATLTSLIPYLFTNKVIDVSGKLKGKILLSLLGLLGPLILILIYLQLGRWGVYDKAPFEFLAGIRFDWAYGVAVGLILYSWRFIDVNNNSLHGFYRDRLSEAYLFEVLGDDKEPVSNDTQKLSDLNEKSRAAPYHLINVALNLQGRSPNAACSRDADFFFFSKYYTGSVSTGYCETRLLEECDPHLDLGTAMAISGAAAAPNMGTTTFKPLAFIMTMLNIRLGYWLPNPLFLASETKGLRASLLKNALFRRILMPTVGPIYLLKELISRLHESSTYVNVSDGGHVENLAIYELLRRRCRYIIACDAEADPNMTFGGLATLQRYAQIDLGITFDFDLDELRRGDNGFSRNHCMLAKIYYPEGETGFLLYLKSSLTGDEEEYIKEYRASHPTFPHQTTADQFFDEAQFEAYRALGFHIVDGLFDEAEDSESLSGLSHNW
jgi:hypothetical protein